MDAVSGLSRLSLTRTEVTHTLIKSLCSSSATIHTLLFIPLYFSSNSEAKSILLCLRSPLHHTPPSPSPPPSSSSSPPSFPSRSPPPDPSFLVTEPECTTQDVIVEGFNRLLSDCLLSCSGYKHELLAFNMSCVALFSLGGILDLVQ